MIGRIKTTKPTIYIYLTEDPSISCEGNFYFLEYLEFKLFRFNLHSYVKFERGDMVISERIQSTSDRIQEICGLLEHLYPRLYSHISRQLKVNFKNEVIICDTFRCFCQTLFKAGISWPRIIALFAFSGGIVVDCIKERKAEFASTVVYCMKAFVEDNLMDWIKDQGGWVSLQLQ